MASLPCKQTKAVSYELSIKQPKRGSFVETITQSVIPSLTKESSFWLFYLVND